MLHDMKKNEDGFSFVLVVMAMVIISAIIISGLALANSLFNMKKSEEKIENVSFSAESAIEEIRAGFEQDASIIISECYESIITSASTIPTQRLDTEFKYMCISDFDVRFTNAQNMDGVVIVPDPSNGVWVNESENYNSHIYNYLVHTDGVEIVTYPEFVADYNNYTFTLKGLSVKYTDPNGVYSGQVTTDIKFTAPNVFYSRNKKDNDLMFYRDYVFVANESIEIAHASSKGNIYAGEGGIVICKDNLFPVYIEGPKISTRGDLNINKQGSVEMVVDEFYTNNIVTDRIGVASFPSNHYTAFDFSGNAFLYGDTILNVPFADIVMRGKYYGFNNANGKESSAFVVNASNVNADLSEVTELFLGGTSYIEIPTSAEGVSILTGESVTGKFTQSIYLVPGNCISVVRNGERIKVSNPIKASELSTLQVDLSQNAINGGIDLTKYVDNTGKPYFTVTTTYSPGQSLDNGRVYIYLKFASVEKASEYAQQYAELDPLYINDRAESFKYGNISINQDSVITTKGNIITNNETEGIVIRKATNSTTFDSIASWQNTQSMKNYATLCSTLGTKTVDTMNDSLFDYVFKTEEFEGGNNIVSNSTFHCDSVLYYDDAITSIYSGEVFKVLIATGDVTIGSDFNGVVITLGNVHCNNNVNFVGTIMAKGTIDIKAGTFKNETDMEESPLEYILTKYDNKEEVRKYFRNFENVVVNETTLESVDIQGTLTYERWNTR